MLNVSFSSQVPVQVRTYFGDVPLSIAQVFKPQQGWRTLPGAQRLSFNKLRRYRREGCTSVAIRAGERVADFTIYELLHQRGVR